MGARRGGRDTGAGCASRSMSGRLRGPAEGRTGGGFVDSPSAASAALISASRSVSRSSSTSTDFGPSATGSARSARSARARRCRARRMSRA
ncbi:MAG: hypothetical protein CMN30_05540 [Sandaracinus sp.]|nr:hypothetical protein [Sandaracinus sp.]